MKRLFVWILFAILLLAAVGCGQKQEVSKEILGVWKTYDPSFSSDWNILLELFSNGTVRILGTIDGFHHVDETMRYSCDLNGHVTKITFSKQEKVQTAEINSTADTMTLTLKDGRGHELIRAREVVLPREDPSDAAIRNAFTLPVYCPVYKLESELGEYLKTGQLFPYDLNGDGTEEIISFHTNPKGIPVIDIGEDEYTFDEWERERISDAWLFQPDPNSKDVALVLGLKDKQIDYYSTGILFLHDGKVSDDKFYSGASASVSEGKLYLSERCDLLGTTFGSRAYVGANLVPESEWYETGILDRVEEWAMTREEQIEFSWLLHVIKALPCTIDDEPAVLEADTYLYFLRWRDTEDLAEVMTEDGRIAQIAFTTEYFQTYEGLNVVSCYCIDGIDSEEYFDNLDHAG